MTTTTETRWATPSRQHAILDRHGNFCPRAIRDSYPLTGTCVCGATIRCADGTADWCHVATRDGRCSGDVGRAVAIVKGKHTNESGVIVAAYSNGPGGRRRTLDVLLGRTGERVTVLRSSVEMYS